MLLLIVDIADTREYVAGNLRERERRKKG